MKSINLATIKIKLTTFAVATVGLFVCMAVATNAASIVVNSTSDIALASDGACTLREAIENANNNSDSTSGDCIAGEPTATAQDVINFNISGSGTHVITLTANFPGITEGLTVDGYSQSGASVNTTASPGPNNAVLKIEIITGTHIDARNLLINGAPNTIIRGLAIGGGTYPVRFIDSPNSQVIGNYIGFHANGSESAISETAISFGDGSDNSRLGGTLASQRNVITSNEACVGVTDYSDNPAQVSSNNVIIAGNYIGLNPSGVSAACGSSAVGVNGSSNTSIGIASATGGNILVSDGGTLNINSSSSNPTNATSIKNNYINVLADGTTAAGNSGSAIALAPNAFGVSDSMIGGPLPFEGNVIVGNSQSQSLVSIFGTTRTTLKGNKIGVNKNGEPSAGSAFICVALLGNSQAVIGGTTAAERNILAAATGKSLIVGNFSITPFNSTLTAEKNSILGNTLYGEVSSPALDLVELVDNDGDFSPDAYIGEGITANDISDVDTGPNNYMNFPVVNSATQNASQAVIEFDLDAADSPSNQYRVEFFARSSYNPMRTTFIGSTTVSNGAAQQTSFTLPDNINLSGYSVVATTTAIDGTTASGFGATSEFSIARVATVLDTQSSSTTLASTGTSLIKTAGLAISLVGGSIGGVLWQKRLSNKYFGCVK